MDVVKKINAENKDGVVKFKIELEGRVDNDVIKLAESLYKNDDEISVEFLENGAIIKGEVEYSRFSDILVSVFIYTSNFANMKVSELVTLLYYGIFTVSNMEV